MIPHSTGDMIEVMMEQRQQVLPGKERPEAATGPVKEQEPSRNVRKDEEWMNLPDRI